MRFIGVRNPRPPRRSLPLDSSSRNAALRCTISFARRPTQAPAYSLSFPDLIPAVVFFAVPSPLFVQRIVQLNLKKGIEDPALRQMLRLSVEPGGCSGFSYKFELEETGGLDEEDDTCAHSPASQTPMRSQATALKS